MSAASGTEAGTTAITVTATAGSVVSGAQTVSLAVTGTAITASDYSLSNSTITIPSGGTTGTVSFTVKDDLLNEGNETATLTISNPSSGITLGTTLTQNITITDDDNAGTSNYGLPAAGVYRVVRNGSTIELYNSTPTLVASRPVGTDPVVIKGTSGNDSLTIDFGGGNFTVPITFNGGLQASTPGDSLTLTGGTFASGTFAFTNANDGTINLPGNSQISYTGLEPIVSTGTTINDLILTFNGGPETIALTDAAGAAMKIDSTLGESLTFANPSSSLTINAGTGDDFVNITSVDTNGPFNAALTINGDANNDTVTLTPALSLASLTVTAETINLNSGTVTTGGDQNYNGAVLLGADTTATGANVTFNGTVDSAGSVSTYVGSYAVSSGPSWTGNPPVYSARQAAALLFGGSFSSYVISTNSNTINPATISFTGWYDGWGESWSIRPQDYSLDLGSPGYNAPGGSGTARSAYVSDHVDFSKINYVWTAGVSARSLTVNTTASSATAFNANVGGTNPLTTLSVTTMDVTAGAIATTTGVTVNNTGTSSNISGAISGTSATLTKSGAGTLTLSGASANTYGGVTTVSAGTLLVNKSSSGTGAVNVNNSAILAGTGSLAGAVNANNTSTIAPGSPASGTADLGTGNLTLGSGRTYSVTLNNTTPDTGHDQLDVTGTVSLGGATLTLGGAYVPNPAAFDTFVIIDNNTSGDAVTGTFNGLPEGASIAFGGGTLFISYVGGDGNDVVLSSQLAGTAAADTLVLRQLNVGQNEYSLNGAAFQAISSAVPFAFNGLGAIDLMLVDVSNGDPIPTGNVAYTGELLEVQKTTGAAAQSAVYAPGTVTIAGFGDITFSGTTNVDFANLLAVDVRTATIDDSLTVANGTTATNGGTVPAGYSIAAAADLAITGTAAGVTVGLRNITTSTIDTTTNSGSADIVTLASATNAHGNVNFNVTTGTGGGATERIDITGAATFTGNVSLTSARINSNATLTAGATSGVTLTANVAGITDGNGAAMNVLTRDLVASSVSGVGTLTEALETTVSKLEAVGGSGGVYIANTGNLAIGGIGGTNGVSATGGNISVVTAGSLTVNEPVNNSGGGQVTLTAGPGGGGGGGGGSGGAFTNVPEAGTYSLVYQLALPNNVNFGAGPVTYNINNSASIPNGSFDRIAYYLELDNGSGLRYAYASMDAFTTITGQTGIPVSTTGATFEQFVANMNVVSNQPGVVNGTGIATGNIEFWHNCYFTTADSGVPGASNATYDFDDDNNSTASCYGSMQVHNYGAAQTILAYNSWANGPGDDLGIGNQVGGSGHPDWTFANNAGTYTVKNLQVLVRATNTASATDDLILNANVTAAGGSGNVTLNAASDILQNTGTVSAAGSGALDYNAGTGTTDGVITMASGTSASTGSGLVTLDADGNISLATVSTGANSVLVTSTAGAILDNNAAANNAAANNVTATSTVLLAPLGVATSGNALETTVTNLEATGGSGGVNISNTGNLAIGGIGGTNGVSATGGAVTVVTAGGLTVNEPVANSGGGNVTLTAASSTGGGGVFQYIPGVFTFAAARTNAATLGGWVATIRSAAENAAVTAVIGGNTGWIGASDAAVEGEWRWVEGPDAGVQFWSGTAGGSPVGGEFNAWNGSEPNDLGNEDAAHIFSPGRWNDLPEGVSLGYVLELPGIAAATDDLVLNANVSATGGNGIVTLNGANDILQNTGTVSAAGSGALDYNASTDSPNGVLTMASGTSASTGSGLVTMDADGNISLATVSTGANSVLVTSTAGAILDNNTTTNNITASQTALVAATGIATLANPLETTVANLEAQGGSGGVFVANTGNLTLGGVSGALTGVTATGGNIDVGTVGSLTLSETVVASGNAATVTLAATTNASLPGGTLVQAGSVGNFGTIAVNIDSDNSGGGQLDFAGDVDAASATFNGNNVADVFNVRPDQDATVAERTPIFVNGLAPIVVPGDVLTLNITGLTSPTLDIQLGQGNGRWSFGNAASVTYTSIETVQTNPSGVCYALRLDMAFAGFDDMDTTDIDRVALSVLAGPPQQLKIDVDAVEVFRGDLTVLGQPSICSFAFIGSNDQDVVDFSALTGPVAVVLSGLGSVDGFTGTTDIPTAIPASGLATSFTNTDGLVGSASSGDTLTGPDLRNHWDLGGNVSGLGLINSLANAGVLVSDETDLSLTGNAAVVGRATGANPITPSGLEQDLAWTSFETLTGAATASDWFDLRNGASLSGALDGCGGNDSLDYYDYTASVTVNLLTGFATGITGGLVVGSGGDVDSSIENVFGGSNADMLTGDADHNILGSGLGSGAGTDTLDGGFGNDVFRLEPGDGFTGGSSAVLTDITGSDTVDFRFAGAGVTIDMDYIGLSQDVFLGVPGTQNVTLAKTGGQTAAMPSPFESVVGSQFNDVFYLVPLAADGNLPTLGTPVFRSIDGNTPVVGDPGVPPGDTYDFDGQGQVVYDTGAVLTVAGLGSVYYTSIESLGIFNDAPRVIDNGDADFQLSAGPYAWVAHEQSSSGYGGDAVSTYDNEASNVARWTFHGVTPGTYRVSTTFPLDPDQLAAVPFKIYDDTRLVTIASADQQSTPNDFQQFGSGWDQLGVFPITGHTLVVELQDPNLPGKYVAADAVRLERLSYPLPATGPANAPELRVQDGGTYLTDFTGSVPFGTTIGGNLTKILTVTNEAPVGGGNLTITAVDLGAAPSSKYSLVVGGGLPLTLIPGASAPITITFSAAAFGEFRDELRIFSNDPDENVQVTQGTGVDPSNGIDPLTGLAYSTGAHDFDPFTLALAGRVANSLVVDNAAGPLSFALTGGWSPPTSGGYAGSSRTTAADGSGDYAQWTTPTLPAGSYRLSTTWAPSLAQATGAKYAVNGVTLVGSYDQTAAPNDLSADGATWEDLYSVGTPLVLTMPGTVTIRVLDAPAQVGRAVAADAIRIERLWDVDVQVSDGVGGPNVADETGVVTYSTTDIGVTVTKTFEIKNVGAAALSLGATISVPAGFELVGDSGQVSLGAGASRTFQLRFNAGSVGTIGGLVSFGTGDADENPFNFTVQGTVSSVQIIDDGAAGFSTTGSWNLDVLGFQADSRRHSSGGGGSTATWTFTGLTAGFYQVSATWPEKIWENTATANFSVTGSDGAQAATVDQRYGPNDLTDGATQWEHLGLPVRVSGGVLTVTLSDSQAANLAVADAIRIERLIGPELVLLDQTGGGALLADGVGRIDLGSTPVGGGPLDRLIEIRNYGATPLALGQLQLPNGYTLLSGPSAQVPVANPAAPNGYGSTTFSVRLPSAVAGPFIGEVTLFSGDFNESPSTFTLDGDVVNSLPTSLIVDDGGAGYADSGWIGSFPGYGGDQRQLPWNAGAATATWTFTGLTVNSLYRVSAHWQTLGGASSVSPFSVYDAAVAPLNLLGAVLIDQTVAPNDFTADGTTWEDLGGAYRVGASGTLVVQLSAAASGTMLADAVRLDPSAAPEIQVEDNATTANVVDGSGPISLGSVLVGGSVARTFTIHNRGTSDLWVQTPILPYGYNLTTAPAATVGDGGSTTFTITLRTDIPAGDYTGDVVFANGDSDENLFNFRVSTTVNPPVSVIDDGDAGYGDTGFTLQTPGYLGDMHTSAAGAGNVATWTFNGLTPGSVQRVSATWQPAGNLATNSPFTVNGNPVVRNQQLAPNDFTTAGAAWEDLGYFVANGSGQIIVTLSDTSANGRVGADAVRVELITTPEIDLQQASTALTDAVSAVDFGTTPAGVPIDQTFTVTNLGDATLTLTNPTLPAGFSLLASLSGTSLTHGQSATFTVRLSAAAAGAFGGNLVLGNNDADESPFEVALSGTVTAGNVAPVIIDNGDAGFSATGAFALSTGSGFAADTHLAPANGGGTSTWTFTGLASGNYLVAVTWPSGPSPAPTSLAPNATYTLNYGGSPKTLVVDQRQLPNDFSADGVYWEEFVGTVNYTAGNPFNITLPTTATSGYVHADAVRVTRLVTPEIQITVGGANTTSGVTTLGYPTTFIRDTAPTKVLVIQNVGGGTLDLPAVISAPTGFKVVGDSGPEDLAPGVTRTLTVQLNTDPLAPDLATPGAKSGPLSIASNDADESTYSLNLSGYVENVMIVDQAQPTFYTFGRPATYSATAGYKNYTGGYLGVSQYTTLSASNTATFTLNNLPAGTYQVSTTYVAKTAWASNSPFTVNGGGVIIVSQQVAPNDLMVPETKNGQTANWEHLGAPIVVASGGSITVVVGGVAANKYVNADAIRVQWLAPQLADEALAGGELAGPSGQTITADDAAPLVAEAVRRWSEIDPAAAAKLAQVQVRVMPLPDGILGLAGVTTPEIWLSANAAGLGWFVDATPQWDNEFAAGAPVAGLDLLSTVTHELGHLLGYPDLDASLHGLDTMAGALGAGLRRMPIGGALLDTLPSTTMMGPARLDELSSLDRGVQPLTLDRDALFAELSWGDWPVVTGQPTRGGEGAGRGRRKERCDAREAHDEVFAAWEEV